MGVIGCGGIAQAAHLPNIAQNPRARLVAAAEEAGVKLTIG